MLATFRLATRIAARLNPELTVQFGKGDWDRLRSAIAIRNRITHPKKRSDLTITAKDLSISQETFYWLLDAAMKAMEAANSALHQYNAEFRVILADLRDGNPTAWVEYRAAASEPES